MFSFFPSFFLGGEFFGRHTFFQLFFEGHMHARSAHFVSITGRFASPFFCFFFLHFWVFFYSFSKANKKKEKKQSRLCQKWPATTGLQNDFKNLTGRIRSKVDDFSTFLCRPVLMAFQKPGRHTFFCADRPIWPTPKEEEDGVNFFLKFEIGFPNTFHLIKFGKCEVVLDPRLLIFLLLLGALGFLTQRMKEGEVWEIRPPTIRIVRLQRHDIKWEPPPH